MRKEVNKTLTECLCQLIGNTGSAIGNIGFYVRDMGLMQRRGCCKSEKKIGVKSTYQVALPAYRPR